jgi:hypothetical protein
LHSLFVERTNNIQVTQDGILTINQIIQQIEHKISYIIHERFEVYVTDVNQMETMDSEIENEKTGQHSEQESTV